MRLSKRQLQVLELVAQGHRTERIAEILDIKPVTVNVHIRRVRELMDARTNAQMVAIAKDKGLI